MCEHKLICSVEYVNVLTTDGSGEVCVGECIAVIAAYLQHLMTLHHINL